MPSSVLPLHLKQTFPPIIWIFTEGEEMESRLPFKISSALSFINRRFEFFIVYFYNLALILFTWSACNCINNIHTRHCSRTWLGSWIRWILNVSEILKRNKKRVKELQQTASVWRSKIDLEKNVYIKALTVHMVIRVVEFSSGGYKIRKIFA